ncbi:MAG: hypothetical protein AABX13_01225 [Nanoarchaeota archaeon]
MNRRSQIQLTETIAILFIFFILLTVGIIFYYQYQKSAIKERGKELAVARTIDTTLNVLFLPELLCSKGEAEPEDNCIDVMKLRQANGTMQEHLEGYYFQLFSFSNITIHALYPEEKVYYLYAQKREQAKNYHPAFFVVTLRDDSLAGGEPYYSYGYVEVGVYS